MVVGLSPVLRIATHVRITPDIRVQRQKPPRSLIVREKENVNGRTLVFFLFDLERGVHGR
jgi:hypothetical protein